MTLVKNRLLNFDNMIIYQDNDYFLFSLDSVLLANFVTIRLRDKKIIDLCSGNAPIPMLLSNRTNARIFGVEIQKKIYKMGFDSIKENKLDKQITFNNYDVREIDKLYDAGTFDIVTCNPPYFKCKSDSLVNLQMEKAIARHEVMINLENVIEKSSYLLKNGGIMALVHRPERMIEITQLMKKYDIEPKRIQFVYPKEGLASNMLLIEGIKHGKSGLKIESPLIVHRPDGRYVSSVRKMFGIEEDERDEKIYVAEEL